MMLRRLPRFQGASLSLARVRVRPSSVRYGRSQLLFSTLSKSPDDKEQNAPSPAQPKAGEVKRLLSLYRPEKKPLAVSISALGVSTVITMCVPYGMGKVIDVVTAGSAAAMPLPTVVTLLGGIFAAGSIANVIRVDTSNMIGERITNRLRQDTYASILRQELGFFDASRTGELLNRLSADTTLIGKVLSDNVASGLRSTGQALGSITMIFVTCPQLAMVMLSVVPPIALGAVSYGRYVKKLTTKVQTQLSEATEVAEEKLGNIRVVRWFTKEPHEVEAHRGKVDEVLALARKRSLASATFFGGVDFGVKMSTLGVLGYGGQMVMDGLLTSGDLTSFLLYTLYVGFSFAGLSSFYAELMKGIGASSRVFELLQRQPKIRVPEGGWTSLPTPFTGHIQFQDVAFAYPTRPESQIFRGLNLEVLPNETLALNVDEESSDKEPLRTADTAAAPLPTGVVARFPSSSTSLWPESDSPSGLDFLLLSKLVNELDVSGRLAEVCSTGNGFSSLCASRPDGCELQLISKLSVLTAEGFSAGKR
ncbi:hypothetical protein PF002_g13725 [Phytophthora fragariae]|uniref:ABC transmembrane type-1 domain-containing protein n=1 Tax=Phytophthora fragariae TaxID=53985 RepID=A0A6A3Z3G5_9STRA|nr:hypothetical protein PF002_g13725 [Phytophthora fragariae]